MYLIDREKNKINKIQQVTFSELGIRERNHLQEWLEGNPEALDEEFLIIQKEFNGFNETNERLDLLALDKNGNIVVIENKLDDTGRDVTWQALKYASYCSTLTKEQIRSIYQLYLDRKGKGEEATSQLCEFFNNSEYDELLINQRDSQRIIFIAGNFRKEVTSTVLWLLNYKLKLQCFKATPYKLGDQILLNLEQIIPTKDAEDYIISMAGKAQEEIANQEELKERHQIRLEYWSKLLAAFRGKSSIFQNSNPTKDHWITAGGTGISGITYVFVVTKSYVNVELVIARSVSEENKRYFDELKNYEAEITSSFGDELSWERLDSKKMCRIAYYLRGVNLFEKADWDKMIDFQVNSMVKFERALHEPLKKVKQKLRDN